MKSMNPVWEKCLFMHKWVIGAPVRGVNRDFVTSFLSSYAGVNRCDLCLPRSLPWARSTSGQWDWRTLWGAYVHASLLNDGFANVQVKAMSTHVCSAIRANTSILCSFRLCILQFFFWFACAQCTWKSKYHFYYPIMSLVRWRPLYIPLLRAFI